MKNQSIIVRGLFVGIGLFLGYAVLLPLISEKTFTSGVREGAIAAAIVIVIFTLVAAVKPVKRGESTSTTDADSGDPS